MDVVDQKAVDALRFMSIDMIEKAQSGHPGITTDGLCTMGKVFKLQSGR